MKYDLERYIKDLNDRIDESVEEQLMEEWQAFVDGSIEADAFLPSRGKKVPPKIEWPHIMVNDALDDVGAMVLQQLELCSIALENGSGELLNVRCNFGTGIIPSMFGADLFEVPYELDTLPCCKALEGGKEAIRSIVEQGVPDMMSGMGAQVFKVAERFMEIGQKYPKIGRYVNIYTPDTQGPLAITEILWGSMLYMDIFDEPDLVHSMMQLATDTFIAFTKKWYELVPAYDSNYAVDWGLLHKGHVLIRNDAAMNIAPDMYETYAMPYDQQILDAFGGGVIHFCGRGDHYVHYFNKMNGVHAINMSQPECNDMSVIYRETVEQGIQIIGLRADEVERCIHEGIPYHGQVHCGAAIAAWLDEETA